MITASPVLREPSRISNVVLLNNCDESHNIKADEGKDGCVGEPHLNLIWLFLLNLNLALNLNPAFSFKKDEIKSKIKIKNVKHFFPNEVTQKGPHLEKNVSHS
jgi:hypothetical protein